MSYITGENPETAPLSKGFGEGLRRGNGLDRLGFEQMAFHPAMLFGSLNKWWGDRGKRDRPHEGLDICLYRTGEGNIRHLGEKTLIPVCFEGEVIKIGDDFLGKSVFVRHRTCDSRGRNLHTIYGHIRPYDCIRPGGVLSEGDIIGTIADAGNRSGAVLSHIHISVAWIPGLVPSRELDWKLVGDSGKVTLLDPLKVIDCPYSIVENVPPVESYQ